MAKSKGPITIKKYANRRLYNTDSSSYVTLDFLSELVRENVEFVVLDAKSGEDITRQVLTQIIFEAENSGSNLLSVNFLRDLISFYGKSVQGFFPSYLEMSMKHFTDSQEQWKKTFSGNTSSQPLEVFSNAMKANMEMFTKAAQAMTNMTPPNFAAAKEDEKAPSNPMQSFANAQLEMMQAQMKAMQDQLDKLAGK
ncbi:MAG: polyhydroxyalkanoate synthesis repressor PhaR [Caulobacterales bacterium]|nr:polyhydroxyalkanoate synthesis repressor PhaR [Caulobacterales bacterium]MCA0373917.1 polyhydroxyalkanoate synthesis repressor PhaR [Pseudomonadota bacterium]